MNLRLVSAAAAAALLAAGAAPSYAMRPRNHIADPKGDAKGNLGFADIVTGNFSTAGRGDQRALVGTLTLAGAPRTDPGFTYTLGAEVDGCGHVEFQYTPLAVSSLLQGEKSFYMFCDLPAGPSGTSSLHNEVSVSVRGRAITWSVPLIVLPPEMGPGALYSQFDAVADVAEPVIGSPVGGIPNQSVDMAFGATSWRLR